MYGGYNIEDLELLGKGTQGKVYKIDSFRCIKIFKSKKVCNKELKTLMLAQKDSHFPRLYSAGEKYIIREYIDGIELDKYLRINALTLDISRKIIEIYEAFEMVGFKRKDAVLFHIFVTNAGVFKVIDTARVMKENTVYPKLLLKGLGELGYKENFLNHVKIIKPELYKRWEKVK